MPGASNLAGALDASERAGALRSTAQAATFTLPSSSPSRSRSTRCAATSRWQHDGTRIAACSSRTSRSPTPMRRERIAGSWRPRAGGPGDVDIKAQLTRANLGSTHRYLPLGAGHGRKDWLRRALVKGTSSDAKLTLAGDLAQFPFAAGKGGQFLFAAKAQDATLRLRGRLAADHRDRRRRAHRRPAPVDRRIGRRACSARASARRAPRSPICTTRGPCCRSTAPPAVRRANSWRSSRRRRSPDGPGTSTAGRDGDGDGQLALKFDSAAARPRLASRSTASIGSPRTQFACRACRR